jgi:nucleotide-binding universal stress UspA family protein
MYRRILLGTDGSPESRRATAAVVSIAGPLQAKVTVASAAFERVARVTEWDFEPVEHSIPREIAEKRALDEVAFLAEHGIEADDVVLDGPAAEALAKYAAQGSYDIIVVGHRGRGTKNPNLPIGGRVATELPDLTHCPVLIVP